MTIRFVDAAARVTNRGASDCAAARAAYLKTMNAGMIAIGVAIGVGIGAIAGNITLGIGLGLAVAIAIGLVLRTSNNGE